MTDPDPSGGAHTARGTEAIENQVKQTRGKRVIRGIDGLGAMGAVLGIAFVLYLIIRVPWGGGAGPVVGPVAVVAAILLGWHSVSIIANKNKPARGKRVIRGFVELGVVLGVGAVLFLAIGALLGGVTYFHTILLGLWVPSLCERYLFGDKGDEGDKAA
ncbi:MAG: hypothetical protein OXF75_05270 [Acidimicrobiaceae bacterium]|nr:hypothetical protein [Acidimicrobiaceae bacterium]